MKCYGFHISSDTKLAEEGKQGHFYFFLFLNWDSWFVNKNAGKEKRTVSENLCFYLQKNPFSASIFIFVFVRYNALKLMSICFFFFWCPFAASSSFFLICVLLQLKLGKRLSRWQQGSQYLLQELEYMNFKKVF
jgi:hypothetical protein